MAENDTSASNAGTQVPEGSGTPDPEGAASQEGNDDVSLLRSRFAGQTAKVNSLTSENASLKEQLAAANKARDEALSGVTQADEASKALLAAKDQELASMKQAIKVAELKGTYPEVFAELGDDAVNLSSDKLAAMEARLQGNAGSGEPPTPRGNNAPKSAGQPAEGPKDKSAADVLAELRSMPLPAEWGGQG